ncbi:NUDIX hydrolase [Variovorax sp. H27-G14]|uniref:NUDIX hydrolase n=1 Tax=Variovorax sp. H27-G14 TaxID=3111914 RepID=UPI0038FC3EA3
MNPGSKAPVQSKTAAVPGVRPVRTAASLIVLRDGAASGRGLEVLMLRRAEKEADQNSGASVFPGGTVDTHDPAMHASCCGLDDAAASLRLAVPANGLDYYVAAVRECFEEAGLLFASDVSDVPGALVPLDALPDSERAALRHAAEQGSDALLHMCRERGWQLAVDRLRYFSHWLTPPGMPRRFDTRFFVALAPQAQTPSADTRETVECLWLTPVEALSEQRALKLMNVTRRILEQLRSFDTAQACIDAAQALREVPMIMPRVANGKTGRQPVNPWEPAYEEVGRLDPDGHGQCHHTLEPGLVVRLSPHVLRVTTGAQAECNSYLVGGGEGNAWALIDPPADAAALAAVHAAAPGEIRWTLRTGDAAQGASDVLDLGGSTLKAVQSSGVNAWLLEEERMLFSGNATRADIARLPEPIDWIAPAQGFLRTRAEPMQPLLKPT